MNTAPARPALPAVDGRSARWDSHRDERRRQLIKDARRAVHQLGPDSSMEEISAFAGTSKSVFYRYFNDKAGLQRAVGDVVLGQMQRRIHEAAKTASSPRQGLLHMVAAYLEMAETSPNVYAFVTQAPVDAGPTTEGGALGDFFDDVIGMIADPMRIHLRQDSGPLVSYWPTAAIGLVRTAGELWLSTPASPSKPRATEMAEQITNWLFLGISAELPRPVDAPPASHPVAQAPSPLPPQVPSTP